MRNPLDLPTLCQAPFAMIRREGEEHIWLLQGDLVWLDELAQITTTPLQPQAGQENFATLNFLPFATARERGFVVHDDGAKIASLKIAQSEQISLATLQAALGHTTATLAAPGNFADSDADYATLVSTVIDDDIGTGAGANFVIPRWYHAQIADYTPVKALAAYVKLLEQERGTYWTFAFYDGSQFLLGATPERHISLQGGVVKMNPISGTLRKAELQPTHLTEQLQAFINDQKETFELLMVVDEELKMIADFCPQGGQIIGPLLKEMAHVVHSEYLLAGATQRDVICLLRDSMFAATVTGSPIESAFRVIHRREAIARDYYGSVLALIGTDKAGQPMLDAPILIRTARISASGAIAIAAGTTIVHSSVPADEVKETYAKAAGIMRAFGVQTASTAAPISLRDIIACDTVQLALNRRNKHLSRFWIEEQNDDFVLDSRLAGKTVLLIENEDSFTHMFAHILRRLGMVAKIVSYREVDLAGDKSDLVIIGPGPGDPTQLHDAKMARLHSMAAALLAGARCFLGVCLGHQILCHQLGLQVSKKQPAAFQGRQEVIDYFGRKQRVGFYNSFVATYAPLPDIEFAYAATSGDVHALRHARYGGVQFHPESILTTNGLQIIHDEMVRLLVRQQV